MESHLRASDAWEIIEGRWLKPKEPSYFRAPIRPEDLIREHKAKHQIACEAVAEGSNDDTPLSSTTLPQPVQTELPAYVEMTMEEAEKELKYIKTHIEEWN
jgi:hypothetical protein